MLQLRPLPMMQPTCCFHRGLSGAPQHVDGGQKVSITRPASCGYSQRLTAAEDCNSSAPQSSLSSTVESPPSVFELLSPYPVLQPIPSQGSAVAAPLCKWTFSRSLGRLGPQLDFHRDPRNSAFNCALQDVENLPGVRLGPPASTFVPGLP